MNTTVCPKCGCLQNIITVPCNSQQEKIKVNQSSLMESRYNNKISSYYTMKNEQPNQDYTLIFYKNELDLKKQKLKDYQERIEHLISEKNHLLDRLDGLKTENAITLKANENFDMEISLMKKKYQEKQNILLHIINEITKEKEELKSILKKKKNEEENKIVDKYEDTVTYKLSTMKKENENLKRLNTKYIDIIETCLLFISNLSRNLPALGEEIFDLNDITDNVSDFKVKIIEIENELQNKLNDGNEINRQHKKNCLEHSKVDNGKFKKCPACLVNMNNTSKGFYTYDYNTQPDYKTSQKLDYQYNKPEKQPSHNRSIDDIIWNHNQLDYQPNKHTTDPVSLSQSKSILKDSFSGKKVTQVHFRSKSHINNQ